MSPWNYVSVINYKFIPDAAQLYEVLIFRLSGFNIPRTCENIALKCRYMFGNTITFYVIHNWHKLKKNI